MSIDRLAPVVGSSATNPMDLLAEMLTGVTGLLTQLRGVRLFAVDLVSIVLASYVAIALRYDQLFEPKELRTIGVVVAIILAVRVALYIRFGLYDRVWRFASVPDLQRVIFVSLLGSLISATTFYCLPIATRVTSELPVPPFFWAAEFALTVTAIGGVRFAVRAAWDATPPGRHDSAVGGRRTLLFGAGSSGALIARTAARGSITELQPVGFLDDDTRLRGRNVAGLRVFGGLDVLPSIAAATGAEVLLITMPSAGGAAVRRVFEAARTIGLEVRTVPAITDIVSGSARADRVRQVKVEDLLGRPITRQHAAGVADIVSGRRIMITGAGGSIGSELARQVHALNPARLILVDRAETPLFEINRELRAARSAEGRDGEIIARLGNVVSRAAMENLIRRERPDVIFHAAAYKHVPMMEDHPSDAIQVNVGGTRALVDAAIAAGVERFVFVSTDKAVRPTSIMGASKRIAEEIVADAARRTGRPYVAVRFGNVLGSNGSVVPIFQRQLELGEPLTITHPDMTRFFMTIPEAAWLILEAAAMGTSGDLFVLDMGQPVRVMDLARDLVRLAGRDPESQPIEVIGLRPGEKLHEELFYAQERVERTQHEKVLRVVAPPPLGGIGDAVDRVLRLANGDSEEALREAVMSFVREAGGPAQNEPRATTSQARHHRDERSAEAGSAAPAA